MRIAMIGQKGIPATHGGVERHVEELGARLVDRGHDVTVFTRPNYTDPSIREHRGMQLVSLPTIGTKHLDAIVHSLLATMHAWRGGIDIVHYHAIGPCLAAPLARLRGRRLVATIHGQDWRRTKWGPLASSALQLGEHMALTIPHRTIPVSESLASQYRQAGHDVVHVPNGVLLPEGEDGGYLSSLGVEREGFILFVGRLVPEKGAHYLLEAWRALDRPMPLVIAGDSSFTDDYASALKHDSGPGVVFPGYVYGEQLATLFRNAALLVLPSDLEGMPLVLLEALSSGTPVLASDIPPNREVLGDRGEYFRAGDVVSLATSLRECIARRGELRRRANSLRGWAQAEYDWDRVTERTEKIYAELLATGAPVGVENPMTVPLKRDASSTRRRSEVPIPDGRR